jgi:hypothetical protein
MAINLIYWGLVFPGWTKGDPAYLWTQRLAHFQFSRLHSVNTVQARDETDPLISVAEERVRVPSADEIRAAFRPSAQRGKMLTDEQKGYDAEISGRNRLIPVPYVNVTHPWVTCIPFYEPMLVEAQGFVTNLRRRTRDDSTPHFEVPLDEGYELVGPDGTGRGDIGKGYALPVADDQRLFGLIGRVAHDETRQPLTEPFFIGARRIIDPAEVGATGCLQLAVNQNPYLSGAKGGFEYSHRPLLTQGGN